MRLLIMGPQGVGKGTQAALLAEHFNIPTISTGDIFRYNIKNKTELGLEAMSYTDKGELVPDRKGDRIGGYYDEERNCPEHRNFLDHIP